MNLFLTIKQLVNKILAIGFFLLYSATMFGQPDYSNQNLLITGFSGGGNITNIAVSPIDQFMMMCSSDMTGVYVSSGQPPIWKMVHHTQLLNVTDTKPCFHPKDKNIIFASHNGGVKVSHDKGISWTAIGNIGGKVSYFGIHPENTDLMLAGSGSSVWRSVNAGESWSKVTGPTGTCLGFHFDRTTAEVDGTCFAATTSGVWVSTDGGISWTKLSLATGSLSAFAGASNKTTNSIKLFCAIGNSVYRSIDKGNNWTLLSSISGETTYLFGSDINPDIVWACQGNLTVRRSTNAGDTWSPGLYNPKVSDLSFNLEHNYFTSWTGQNVGTSFFNATNSAGNPDFLAFTTSMVFMYTVNGGQTWKSAHSVPVVKEGESVPKSFLNTGLNNTTTWHYYVDPFNSDLEYICYTDIGFARSVDKGKTWLFWPYRGPSSKLPYYWSLNTYEIAFDPEIPGKMWGAFSGIHDIPNSNSIVGDHYTSKPDAQKIGGIGFSSNFAATWEDDGYNSGLPNRPAISVIVDPTSPKNKRTLYVAQYDQGVFKSTDDGHNWTKKSTGLGSATNMHVVRLQLHKDGTLFCLVTADYSTGTFSPDGVGLYKSTNGGDNWVKVNASKNLLWPRDFALNPENSSEIYIGAKAAGSDLGGIFKTTNGGATWTALVSVGNYFGVYLHPTRPGWIYYTICEGGTTAGLWLSKNYGATWDGYEKVPHRWIQRIDFDKNNPDMLYVSTFGSSVMKLPADPNDLLVTKSSSIRNSDIHLFPNPCHDYLTINASAPVDYKIFDIQGKLMEQGKLSSNQDQIPIRLMKGVYLISINDGKHNVVRKFFKQ